MHRALLFTCLSLAFLVTGCSDEFYLERQEDKIIGAWEFEKVFYKADNALFRDNITGDYANDIIEFYDDYTAIYDDYSLGKVYPGDWLIRLKKTLQRTAAQGNSLWMSCSTGCSRVRTSVFSARSTG